MIVNGTAVEVPVKTLMRFELPQVEQENRTDEPSQALSAAVNSSPPASARR